MNPILAVCLILADAPAGWPEMFPTLGNFERKVQAPLKDKDEKAYSQATRYEWLGGRFEILTITIARDPKFKERYSAETIKAAKPTPSKIEVNKKTAYLWEGLTMPDDLVKVNKRLVVILEADKVLIVEQIGFGLELEDVAKKLDFEKLVKALESPPPVKK